MKRHCLFIDDDIEEFDSVLQKLPGIAKAKYGIEVTYDKLNPTNVKYQDEKKDIDLNKLEEDFASRISENKYDLVACDFDLGDEMVFGTDIIKQYRQRDRKFIGIIYSADLKHIVRRIIDKHDPKDVDKTLNQIIGLVTSRIDRFFSKNNNLMDDITPLLRSITSEKHIEQTLLNLKDLKMTHGFAMFIGKPLGEIAGHVRQDTDEGKKFVEELIERGISHIIKLNE